MLYRRPDRAATNLLKYRFLRAIELGFGLFALRFWREIYRVASYNRRFLATMACGAGARLLGLIADGWPSIRMDAFLGFDSSGSY